MRRDIRLSLIFSSPERLFLLQSGSQLLVNLEPADTLGTESMFVEREEKKYKLSRERGRWGRKDGLFQGL